MSSLKSYLTTIANAIREKKGTTEPINASNFASEILSIQGGGSLNVAYFLTPPTDTSKIWLQCAEPSGVEVQNYIGEVSVGNVANYGGIDNPVSEYSYFRSGYFNNCYIGNNQIAIVGYNHIRIYDLTSKSYIADYTISVGTSNAYSYNAIYKNNLLYFGYETKLYSFDLSTQTLTEVADFTYKVGYFYFYNDTNIDSLCPYSDTYHYRYNLTTKEKTTISSDSNYKRFANINNHTIKVKNTVYNFMMSNTTDSINKYAWKYNISTLKFSNFTSFYDFMTELGYGGAYNQYWYSSVIYDNEHYIYLIGGTSQSNVSNRDLIIRYDIVNDSFELLDNKLLDVKYNHFSVLVDGRVYIYGGGDSRKNQIDYFDLQYTLPQNNAIITTNTINTDNALPLINTEKLKLNSNIASAYLGNADNLAEKVNAYYYDGSKWAGINCEDYVESESSGTGGGISGGGDVTTDPEIPVDKPVEI